jgi:tRNA(Ile)-lysidine synthetase-like protein
VRTALVPLLVARLGDRVRDDLHRLASAAAGERRAWDRVLELLPDLELHTSDAGFDVVRGVLARYDDAVAVAVLRAAARRAGLVLGPARARRLLALAAGASGRRVELGLRWVGDAEFERLVVRRATAGAHPDPVVAGAANGRASFGGFAVTWRAEVAPERIDRTAWTTWLAGPGWQVRTLAAGDELRPLGGVGHRPVRRLLMEARVPRGERAAYPVLTRGDTILWVPGVCRSADELPAPGTQAVRVDVSGTAGA